MTCLLPKFRPRQVLIFELEPAPLFRWFCASVRPFFVERCRRQIRLRTTWPASVVVLPPSFKLFPRLDFQANPEGVMHSGLASYRWSAKMRLSAVTA